jgi:glycosyltransferase involved in cell wall biosynthesis
MKDITIITINFNNAKGLKKTIDSVVSQTFQDFEYIVIDGCSKDESVEFIKQSSRIDYWVSEKDKGIYDAMNKGINKANGKFCLFLNSGDYLFSSDTLESIHHLLTDDADIVYGNMKIEYENGNLTDGFMPVNIDRKHMMQDTLWHPVSFIRTSLFHQYGLYDMKYAIVADYKWFLDVIFNHSVRLLHVDGFISVFEMGGVSNAMDTIGKLRAERRSAQIEVFGKNFVTLYYLKLKWTGYLKRLIKKFGFK